MPNISFNEQPIRKQSGILRNSFMFGSTDSFSSDFQKKPFSGSINCNKSKVAFDQIADHTKRVSFKQIAIKEDVIFLLKSIFHIFYRMKMLLRK